MIFFKFSGYFFKDFIKTQQSTIALTFLTHIISGIDGVICLQLILGQKSCFLGPIQLVRRKLNIHHSLCICCHILICLPRPFKRGGKCVTNLSRHNSQEYLFMQHILRVFLVSAWSQGPILVLFCTKKHAQKTNYSKNSFGKVRIF